jgi:ATP-binding cassette, subfamily C, bacterial CydD
MTTRKQEAPDLFSTPRAWLGREARTARNFLILAVCLGWAGGMLLIAQASLLATIVHDVVFNGYAMAEVFARLMLLPPIMAMRFVLVWAGEHFGFRGAARVKADIRQRLYAHLLRLGPERLRTRSIGDLTHQVVDGVEGLEAYYARFLPQAALAGLIPLAVLAFVFPLDLTSGLILLGAAPFVPVFMVLIGSQAEKLNQRQWRRLAALSARFLDSLQGLTTIKMFGASRREAEIIVRITDDYRQTTLSVLRFAFLSALILELIATVSMAMVAVFIGFRLLSGEMAFQTGFFILLLVPEFFLPLRALGSHYHSRLSASAAAEGLLAILDEPPPDSEPTDMQHPRWSAVGLQLDNLCFAHTPAHEIVCELNLQITPGSFTVLAGLSGVGKTTLLRLLLGSIAPDKGRILCNGIDLSHIAPAAWHAHIAWMPQEPYLFQGSIKYNARLWDDAPETPAQREALQYAAARTGLDKDIAALPHGWDTQLGEGGQGLSGGQRRRLALTRAMLKHAPLVILDEPTAHLDDAGRHTVIAALRSMAGQRTVVIASHDPAVLAAADRVVDLAKECERS